MPGTTSKLSPDADVSFMNLFQNFYKEKKTYVLKLFDLSYIIFMKIISL